MDVLVTGADGFIGSHLCRRLARTCRVFAVTRRDEDRADDGIVWIRADLTRPDFESALPGAVDGVVALAQSRHHRGFPEEACDLFEVNQRATFRLLEWSRRAGAGAFVYASSANVYRRSDDPVREDDPLASTSFYARSKRMAELVVESYADLFPCVVLRLFTVYGPGQTDRLIPSLIDRVIEGRPIDVEGPEGLVLSPIFVSDLCDVLTAVVTERPMPEGFTVLNVGGDRAVSVLGLATLIGELAEIKPQIERIDGASPGGWVADCSRLRARFSLPPFTSLEDGLRQCLRGVCT